MSNKLRATTKRNKGKNPNNIEELAARARIKRQEVCSEEVNAVLRKHNCTLDIALQLGNQAVKLNAIVALPGAVRVISK